MLNKKLKGNIHYFKGKKKIHFTKELLTKIHNQKKEGQI